MIMLHKSYRFQIPIQHKILFSIWKEKNVLNEIVSYHYNNCLHNDFNDLIIILMGWSAVTFYITLM